VSAPDYHDADSAAQSVEAEFIGVVTLRDEIALQVLPFCLSRRLASDAMDDYRGKMREVRNAASEAYMIADVMLLARVIDE
jgi:hypothetical protein